MAEEERRDRRYVAEVLLEDATAEEAKLFEQGATGVTITVKIPEQIDGSIESIRRDPLDYELRGD